MAKIEIYKRNQGRITRLATLIAAVLVGGIGAVLLGRQFTGNLILQYGLPVVLILGLGALMAWIVNRPKAADFLIATEAEMNKVSWTSKDDLYRATTVVLATVLLMTVFLFAVDWLWLFILRNIGVLQFAGGGGFGSTA